MLSELLYIIGNEQPTRTGLHAKRAFFLFPVSYFEAFVPKDPNHTLFFKSGENYEAFLDRVIQGHKQKKGFRRFSFLRAWELLRDRSIIGGTKVQEASQNFFFLVGFLRFSRDIPHQCKLKTSAFTLLLR